MVPYYERLGWRALDHRVHIDQSSGLIEAPFPAMVLLADGAAVFDTPLVLGSLPW
jgi:hypothetical protein